MRMGRLCCCWQLPRYLSGLLMRRLERRGVEVIAHTSIKYVGKPMEWELAEVANGAQLTINEKEIPLKVRSNVNVIVAGALNGGKCVLMGHGGGLVVVGGWADLLDEQV